MNDLVERLRSQSMSQDSIFARAADEIERLRAALEEYGRHAILCDYDRPSDPKCTCGFEEILAACAQPPADRGTP